MLLLPPLKRLCKGCEQVHHDEHNILKLTHKVDRNKIGASLPEHPQPGLTGNSKTESRLKWCVMALHIDAPLEPLCFFRGRKQPKLKKKKKDSKARHLFSVATVGL